jgi:hypothetical protein
MTESPVNHEANRGSLPPLAPCPQSHSPTIRVCVRCLHASYVGRRECSVSVVLSEVPLSVRGARPLRKAPGGRYARRRRTGLLSQWGSGRYPAAGGKRER